MFEAEIPKSIFLGSLAYKAGASLIAELMSTKVEEMIMKMTTDMLVVELTPENIVESRKLLKSLMKIVLDDCVEHAMEMANKIVLIELNQGRRNAITSQSPSAPPPSPVIPTPAIVLNECLPPGFYTTDTMDRIA